MTRTALLGQNDIITLLSTSEALQRVHENQCIYAKAGKWTKRLECGIKRGGQAEVIFLQDPLSEKRCAKRTARLQPKHFDSIVEDVRKECEILVRLKHPHIVDCYHYYIENDKCRVQLYMEAMNVSVTLRFTESYTYCTYDN